MRLMRVKSLRAKQLLSTMLAAVFLCPASYAGQASFYSEEHGTWFTYPPPPARTIETQDIYSALAKGTPPKATFKSPEAWRVRAIYIGVSGELFEFDRQGRVIYDSDGPADLNAPQDLPIRMEQVFLGGRPLWIGATVFSRVNESAIQRRDPSDATFPAGLVQGKNGQWCPLRETKHRKAHGLDRFTLDGDCERAISVTIAGIKYWTYPAFKGIKEPYFYWTIQYFDDPIAPFPSAGETCRLYCDGRSPRGG